MPSQTVLRQPPKNIRQEDEGFFSHEYEKILKPTYIFYKKNCEFLPNGFLVKPWHFLPESVSYGTRSSLIKRLKGMVKTFLLRLKTRRSLFAGKALILTDDFSNGYFHWLADCLPKLMLKELDLTDGVLLLPSYGKAFKYMGQSLDLLGIKYRILEPDERVLANRMLGSTPLGVTGNYRPDLMIKLRENFKKQRPSRDPFRRIFISRAMAKWRKISNELDLFPILKKYNFEIVHLEEFTFEDQVRLLAETKVLVGNHGAGLTNMLFQPAGGKVLELRLFGDKENNCYYSLANALGIEYNYLICHPDNKNIDPHTADVIVNVEGFKNEIINICENING